MPQHPSDDGLTFFVTCPRNTEGLLLDELRALGTAGVTETRGGVSFTGPLPLAYRACLWSRVASRVLLRLTAFPVSSPDDLYEGIHALPWEDHLDRSGTLAVEVTSTVRLGPLATLNTHFAEQRVKDAVVDRFRARTGARPGVDLARPHVRINVHLTPTDTVVSVDLSGDGLHRRGYRLEGGEAPLKENLAAAILMRAGWPRLAATGAALLDPMCGSGTLLIEGALLAADVAPGLLRDYYGFLGWKGFEPRAWDELLAEARDRREAGLRNLPPLFGFDREERAVGTARANARRAGLAGRVDFQRGELAALKAPDLVILVRDATPGHAAGRSGATSDGRAAAAPVPGLVVTNPPYGKRLGEVTELVPVYEALGERLKASFSGWEAAVFTGNPELSAHLGLRAHRTNALFNGPLECRLLVFHIGGYERGAVSSPPGGGGAAQAPAAGAPASDTREPGHSPGAGAVMFANRLHKNLKHLRRWAARDEIHCYRLYDADLPEYAVAVDLYENWAHVQEYAPPSSVDPVRARRRLKEVMAVVPDVLEIPASHVVLKVRRPQRGSDQYERLRDEGRLMEVREGGLKFLVNLTDYLDTGLFLDHRVTRGLIRELAPGRRFLNLFAYTGSATVYAAAGGAASTTTVDLSATYLDWARRNLELNGLAGSRHGFVRADCLEWLALVAGGDRSGGHAGRSTERGGRLGITSRPGAPGHVSAVGRPGDGQPGGAYDLIFLDAPTFSNSKSMTTDLDLQRDHADLIRAAAALLAPEGILLFSTNFRRFKLDPAVAEAFSVTDITKQTIPPDFARNPRIHQCYRLTARPGGRHAR